MDRKTDKQTVGHKNSQQQCHDFQYMPCIIWTINKLYTLSEKKNAEKIYTIYYLHRIE